MGFSIHEPIHPLPLDGLPISVKLLHEYTLIYFEVSFPIVVECHKFIEQIVSAVPCIGRPTANCLAPHSLVNPTGHKLFEKKTLNNHRKDLTKNMKRGTNTIRTTVSNREVPHTNIYLLQTSLLKTICSYPGVDGITPKCCR